MLRTSLPNTTWMVLLITTSGLLWMGCSESPQPTGPDTSVRSGADGASVLSNSSSDRAPKEFTIDATGLERSAPCLGETVKLTEGLVQVKIKTFTDRSAGIHFSYHSHWKPRPKGIGLTTGTIWTGQGTKSISRTIKPPFPKTVTRVDNSTLTSKGSAPNLLFRLRVKMTVNSKGEVSINRQTRQFACPNT